MNVPRTILVIAALWAGGFAGGVREAAAAQQQVESAAIANSGAGPCYWNVLTWICPITSTQTLEAHPTSREVTLLPLAD